MADEREPPPLFDEEDVNLNNDSDNDDLFGEASDEPPKKEENETAPVEKKVDSPHDLFAEEGSTVPLNDGDDKSATAQAETQKPPEIGISSPPTVISKPKTSFIAEKSKEEVEEEASGDKFNIEVKVSDPMKVGDGMGAYMTYRINTKTNIPCYKKQESEVSRRFSDFLGLHEKLVERYLSRGTVIPPAPEKSLVGMTKIKMSKEESGSSEFVERRRAALERYLNRTVLHPSLSEDCDVREFLEFEGDLPRATGTSTLSGAGVMRLFNKIGDSVGKMGFKMEETDQWFEEKQQQIENLDQQLRKLHASTEALVGHRRDLSVSTASFAKSCAMLANSEEHTSLSRALSQLAEIEERVDQLHHEQAEADFFILSEFLKDYIHLIGAVKDTFQERIKIYKNWKDAEVMLTKKRENKAKLELAHKTDKLQQAQQEINEWEGKVDRGQDEFQLISESIKKEMHRFEKSRVKDFKTAIIQGLEHMMETQQKLIKYWEAFLPEAKAIA